MRLLLSGLHLLLLLLVLLLQLLRLLLVLLLQLLLLLLIGLLLRQLLVLLLLLLLELLSILPLLGLKLLLLLLVFLVHLGIAGVGSRRTLDRRKVVRMNGRPRNIVLLTRGLRVVFRTCRLSVGLRFRSGAIGRRVVRSTSRPGWNHARALKRCRFGSGRDLGLPMIH